MNKFSDLRNKKASAGGGYPGTAPTPVSGSRGYPGTTPMASTNPYAPQPGQPGQIYAQAGQ